jgi:hypothetical protein
VSRYPTEKTRAQNKSALRYLNALFGNTRAPKAKAGVVMMLSAAIMAAPLVALAVAAATVSHPINMLQGSNT